MAFSKFIPLILLLAFACKSSQTGTQAPTTPTDTGLDEGVSPQILYDLNLEKGPPAWVREKGPYNPEATRHFQLLNTTLHVAPDWAKEHLHGTAILTLSPHFYPQNEVTLDAKGFDLHRVGLLNLKDTLDLKHGYDGQKLTVQLGKTYQRGDRFQLVIRYTARPNDLPKGGSQAITDDKGLYFINAAGTDPYKPRQLWTQGETEASSCWFPTFDAPNVKTTQDLYFTVDTALATLSNGRLVAQQVNKNGTRTDYWKQEKPHAPYLFMIAAGRFQVVKDEWKGLKVDYYMEPEYAPYARDIFGHTPEMIGFFSDLLDFPFPWEKYSQVVVRDFVSGAMENTSATVFMEELNVDRRSLLDSDWEGIIAHELFHQWFGNVVTCESWANLALNEAFATYAEYLWAAHKHGNDEAALVWKGELDSYLRESEDKQEPIVRYHYHDREDMFDSHSYAKAGMMLHLLRNYLGDPAFFESLRRYLKQHAYKATEIHHLRLVFEEVSGQDLNWFFDQWFMKPGHPSFFVKDSYDNGELTLTVAQTQDPAYTPIYRIHVDVDVWHGGKATRHRLEVTEKEQYFTFKVPGPPQCVLFDPESLIPGLVDHIKPSDYFLFQAQAAGNVLHRLDALDQFKNALDEPGVPELMLKALDDPFWKARETAIGAFARYEGSQQGLVLEKLKTLALNDPKAAVRAAAVNVLASLGPFTNIFSQTLQDSSYEVMAYSLYALAIHEPAKARERFRAVEGSNDLTVLSTVADFYSYMAIPDKFGWFKDKIARNGSGQKLAVLLNYLGSYLMQQSDPAQKKEGVEILLPYARNHRTQYTRQAAFQSLSLLTDVPGVQEAMKEIFDAETDEKLKQFYRMLGVD